MRAGGSYEDLEYLATDKSTLHIEPHFEDYEDDGLPMFDFVMEDGDTQDVISLNGPLKLRKLSVGKRRAAPAMAAPSGGKPPYKQS